MYSAAFFSMSESDKIEADLEFKKYQECIKYNEPEKCK